MLVLKSSTAVKGQQENCYTKSRKTLHNSTLQKAAEYEAKRAHLQDQKTNDEWIQ